MMTPERIAAFVVRLYQINTNATDEQRYGRARGTDPAAAHEQADAVLLEAAPVEVVAAYRQARERRAMVVRMNAEWVAWLNGPAHVVDELAPTVPLCGAPAGRGNVYDAASNRKRCPKCVVLTSSGNAAKWFGAR
jgi:hypothetical protein